MYCLKNLKKMYIIFKYYLSIFTLIKNNEHMFTKHNKKHFED